MNRLLALVAAIVTAVASASAASGQQVTPAVHVAPATRPPASSALPPGRAWTVTLITGDVIQVRTTVSGKPPLVTIKPGPGRQHVIFHSLTSNGGQIEVVPADVAPLVGNVLDPTLFDVTALIINRDDDAHRADLPLIVQARPGSSPLAAIKATIPAFQPGAALSSINAVAVSEPRASAGSAGQALSAVAAAIMGGRGLPRAAGGIGRIWLDKTICDSSINSAAGAQPLDHNLVQIGAPTAWRAGDTGRGTKVAVLDSGVDATHPDLAGQIVAEKNFTSDPNVTDHLGHGTFVASEIAGTGVAADGARRGVAFGAKLVIGKVLGNNGCGVESALIAGMQWAAVRSKVINVSLQSYTAGGTDPAVVAVNHLTTTDHVLFVIAAGDSGPNDQTVLSPGLASEALTVGAVDAADHLASFSSRGPVPGSFAIKPEITAPGVNIVGARAAGTAMGSPLDAHYTIASGTSMATPEVAGAAAILAALHPTWSPAELKAALVSTAHAAYGGDAYELGGGMLNIGTTVTGTLVADQAIADFGAVPSGSTTPITRPLSWTSTGKTPAVITLSAKLTDHFGHPAPTGAVTLAATRLTVTAGGTASTTLTLKPGLLAGHGGFYEGTVTASVGSQSIRTPISLYVSPRLYALTLRATPLSGTLPGHMFASAFAIDMSDTDLFQASIGLGVTQVPAGRYWVAGTVEDVNPSNPLFPARSAVAGPPEVNVAGNTTVTLDGSTASQATATIPGHPTTTTWIGIHEERTFAGQLWGSDLYSFSPHPQRLYAQPTGGVSTGTFRVFTDFGLTAPGAVYDLYHDMGDRVPTSMSYDVTPAQQATLARINERFYALDGNAAAIPESRYGLTPSGFLSIQTVSTVPAGSRRTDYVSTEAGILWSQEISPPIIEGGQSTSGPWTIQAGFRHFAPGSVQTMDWAREPFRPGPYSATRVSVSFCTPQPVWRDRGNIHVELVDLQDVSDGFDCLGGLFPDPAWASETSRAMRFYSGHTLIGSATGTTIADFTVPQAPASYRLTYTDSTSKALPVSTQTSTTWTFRSVAPSDFSLVRIPLLVVYYDLPLDLRNHPTGRTAVLSVATVAGTPAAAGTALHAWTSTDGGHTWKPAATSPLGGGRYTMALPAPVAGQSVSIRVSATDNVGSGIDQTIMTAYHG